MLTVDEQTIAPDVRLLTLTGRITLGRDAQYFEWQIQSLIDKGVKELLLDLTAVQHIDSSGIGIIMISAGRLTRAGGSLRISGAQPHVGHTLGLCKVDSIVPIYATREDAVGAMLRGRPQQSFGASTS